MNNNFEVPILFIVFNRPDTTKRVLEAIGKIRPSKLFIAADGPRKNKIGEKEKCEEVRNICKKIDWECEVFTLFQEKNLGCKIGATTAVNWFFQNVSEGIILEDDCLPNQSFFTFCKEMLEKYRDNEKILHISGTNLQYGNKREEASYYFSRYIHMWGWATWKRAWEKYDIDMKGLEEYYKSKKIYKLFNNKKEAKFWISLIKYVTEKNIDTWDAQWVYTLLKSEGMSITPNVNLVENIGFGENATHTKSEGILSNISTERLEKIIHPESITVNEEADKFVFETIFYKSLFKKIIDKIKIIFKL